MKTLARFVLLASLLVLPACDETDAVSVRLRVAPDFSGTLTLSSLRSVAAESQVALPNSGVRWNSQVELRAAAGEFTKLDELKLSDTRVSGGEGPGGLCFVRIELPRGENAQWARELVPLDAAQRKSAARALDPKSESDGVGESIKWEVTLPGKVLGNGLSGRTRGVKLDADNEVATLIVPVTTALSTGEALVWHITWQK